MSQTNKAKNCMQSNYSAKTMVQDLIAETHKDQAEYLVLQCST